MNQRANYLAKLVVNLPNDIMASEDPSTPLLLQVFLCFSTNIIKDFYQNLGRNMGQLPDLEKRAVAVAIMRKWGERILVMGSDACIL